MNSVVILGVKTDKSKQTVQTKIRPLSYKKIFKLNSAEHEIFHAHKCQNANNCWHFNIYEQEK